MPNCDKHEEQVSHTHCKETKSPHRPDNPPDIYTASLSELHITQHTASKKHEENNRVQPKVAVEQGVK